MAAEPGLDESADPEELVLADLPAIDVTVGHLRTLSAALERTAQGLRGIEVGHWSGEAADAFRARFDESPTRWFAAADAFVHAAAACEAFRRTVARAREQAARAVELYRSGVRASEAAVADRVAAEQEFDALADAAASGQGPLPAPLPEFRDPGVPMIEQAVEMLAAARRDRDAAGDAAAVVVQAAAEVTPPPPSLWVQFGAEFDDGVVAEGGRFLAGVGEGVEDLVRSVRTVNPADPWNATHPASYVDGLSATAAGLVTTNLHPSELVTGMVGTGWGSDPAAAEGRLIPGLALSALTGGAGKVAERAAAPRGPGGVVDHAADAVGVGPDRPPPKVEDSPDLPARAELNPQYRGEENGSAMGLRPGHRVTYFDDLRREAHRLTVHAGRLYDQDGEPFESAVGGSHWSRGEARSIFVMDPKGNLYASNEQQVGLLHHSSFMAGQPVAGAGEIEVVDGRIRVISDRSGHYTPGPECLSQVIDYLASEGVDFDGVKQEGFND